MRLKPKEKVMSEQSKSPTHIAYQVRDGKQGSKGFWTRIGAAWTNKDGSLGLQLDVVPLDGRVQLRVATEKKD
jgi:hypothetical protein